MEGWIGEQRGKFLEMSAQVLILKSLDNSLTHFFTHKTFLKYLLEGTAAGARVNWKANANGFPAGPLGLLNHSALTFRLPSITGLGSHVSFIQCLPLPTEKSPNCWCLRRRIWELAEVLPHLSSPRFHPQPIYCLPLGWYILVSFGNKSAQSSDWKQ